MNELCVGPGGDALCTYAVDNRPGERAKLQPGQTKCLFCDCDVMKEREKARRGQDITTALKKLMLTSPDFVEDALKRIALCLGNEQRDHYRNNAEKALQKKERRENPPAVMDVNEEWKEVF